MLSLIFFLLGSVTGWFLKFAFDFYHAFKDTEMKRANEIDEILTNFKAIEKLKIWEKEEKKPRPM